MTVADGGAQALLAYMARISDDAQAFIMPYASLLYRIFLICEQVDPRPFI
jgi:hypothetical protein